MTEYEQVRSHAESAAVKEGAMTLNQIRQARYMRTSITARCGLTPERVWQRTRHMRVKVNGGER